MFGDKGYSSDAFVMALKDEKEIDILPLKKNNAYLPT